MNFDSKLGFDDGLQLSDLVLEVGSISTWTPAVLDKVLAIKKYRITDSDAATLLVKIVMTASQPMSISKTDLQFLLKEPLSDVPEQPQAWNIENLFTVLLQRTPSLSLVKILKYLDTPEFEIRDYQGVSIVSAAFNFLSSKSQAGFPVSTLLESWTNPKSQFTLIVAVVRFMPDLLIQSKTVTNYIFAPEILANKLGMIIERVGLCQGPQALVRSPWNVADLVVCLVRLLKSEICPDVSAFIESTCLLSPELMLLGLAQLPIDELSSQSELVLKLTQVFIAGHPSSSFVVPKLYESNPNILISGMVRIYASDVYSLSRILDISQELKALPKILESKPFFFAIDLAALASRRDFLNLEKWLQDRIRVEGPEFVKACLGFLHDKVVNAIARNEKSPNPKPSIPLSPDVIETFNRILQTHQSMMNAEQCALLAKLSIAGQQMSKEEVSTKKSDFPKETEDASNSFFERLYKRELSVIDVLASLQAAQASTQQRDNDLANCMIQNLFEEYKYYPQYPEKELLLTAQLFGTLIQHKVLDKNENQLAVGLRAVLDSLKHTIDTPIFKFGHEALLQFRSRLNEWPQYVAHLVQITHLKDVNPELFATLERLFDPSKKEKQPQPPQPDIFTCIQFDTYNERIEIPDEKTQDRILFIINNVSSENIEHKIREMSQMLTSHTIPWFSRYLVEKRVSLEPNFHQLYIDFLVGLNSRQLESSVVQESVKAIKTLLNSEKIISLQSDRVALKNLASWLGGITLAKNRPIKHINIAFKDLLLEGYDSNRLVAAIPFVCKVLEQVTKSTLFRPPNPWLMGIMKVLAEMYHFAELKLNLKFEIEVLCKAIKLNIKEISPTGFLRERPVKGAHGLSVGMQKMSIQTSEIGSSGIDNLIANIVPFIVFNASLPQISNNAVMRKLVVVSITKAIEEIIAPVVERSITIAGIATKELIIKDFALESDENKMRQAAHRMVQSLAGSLASVTCREPLRIGIIQNLRNNLLQQGFTEQTLPDQTMFVIVSDNLDLACSVIEKTSSEKAIEEVDKNLTAAFDARKKHRERSAQPFYDMSIYTNSRYPSTLPESLRLRTGGVSPDQLKVYEDFVRLNRSDIQERTNRLNKAEGKVEGTPSDESYPLSLQATLEKLDQVLGELESAIDQAVSAKIDCVECPEVQLAVKNLRVLAVQSVNRDDATLIIAQRCVGNLYATTHQAYRLVYSLALEKVLELSTKSSKEVNSWFVYSIDERRYNIEVYSVLAQRGVLIISELDVQLGRLVDVGSETQLLFVTDLVDRLVLAEGAAFTATDLFITIDMLKRIAQNRQVPVCVTSSVERIVAHSQISACSASTDLKPQFALLFDEWTRIFSHPSSNETIQSVYIQQIINQSILATDEVASLFFRCFLESVVEKYSDAVIVPNMSTAIAYAPVDGFARFVTLMAKLTEDDALNPSARVRLFSKVLSITVLVMVNAHETEKVEFNQKPYFRFFTSLLNNLNTHEDSLKSDYFNIITTFHSIQPVFMPGFTFSWLQIVSHRHFMPKLLKDQKGWSTFHQLISDLLKFLAPHIRTAEFTNSVRYLYRGTLRLLLILLHDFPEFLCSYHLSLMDALPLNCIQMRNLILSAFPSGMRLPDPFTPNLKVDQLPEINESPQISSDQASLLVNMQHDLDHYLTTRNPHPFLNEVIPKLLLKKQDQRYNVPVLNALILYAGAHSLAYLQSSSQPPGPLAVATTPAMDLYTRLLSDLDNQGRYILISSLTNHLRYPNAHTHFFSCCLFHLFLESPLLIVKEQITRVLLERLIVNRPHPYGLLITFIELIRNPKYKFWEHTSFIRCAPEIERLFSSVSKSINSSFAG